MSPQGIQSMLHMRMIERRRRFDPPQYRLARAADEDDDEDISDDIPPVQDEPPSQPPPRHHPIHAAASLSEVSATFIALSNIALSDSTALEMVGNEMSMHARL
ncbi:hypothetical protein GOBAR_AA19166 [Gossypium barbadense]|uniref:Uncharacterized protein n=1 Tax=Gossypium barbadense TaxID=3634 RepID=A0A2P5XDT4_GOSBA|nr:hypothetical protein GOBAR_AA19166 [Gossypium barbadense]